MSYGSGYCEIKFPVLYLFCPGMLCSDILQTDRIPDSFNYLDLLTDTVYKMKLCIRKKDGKGNTGKTAARADVDHLHPFVQLKGCGNAEGMQYMLLIQTV